jgi:Ribbon-helix-helix protein, copG family
MRQIHAGFDDHDYEQLALLARLNGISINELVRRLCRAYLDNEKPRRVTPGSVG